MSNLRFAPDFRIEINGKPVPALLRASTSSVSLQTSFDGSDRVELTLVNEGLRWLDHELLRLDNSLALYMGYAPDPLEKMFAGEIIAQSPTFPSGGSPMLTVSAQDRREHLQSNKPVRWFAVPIPSLGNTPVPDPVVASLVAIEHFLIPIFDPIGAALSVLIGGVQVAVAATGDSQTMQKIIRKQLGESNLDFLKRLSQENGWELFIDHSGPRGGWQLRFFSLADHLAPDIVLKYGQSLVDFTPRITKVGQIVSISTRIWVPSIKTAFTITAGWDWDRNSLDVNVSAGYSLAGSDGDLPGGGMSAANQSSGCEPQGQSASSQKSKPEVMLLDEPLSADSAPRVLLSKLLTKLNQRLTGSGSVVGDPRIRPGTVLQLEGLGRQFGGLYRVTSATHTLDGSGYRTTFDVRKEIWFGSLPAFEQGATGLRLQGQRIF